MAYLSVWRGGAPQASKKSDVLSIVRALQERIPWLLGRRVLELHGVPTGNGWENTFAEIGYDDALKSVDVDGLYGSYLSHVRVGEKSVRFFDIGAANASTLRDYFKSRVSLNGLPLPRLKSSLKGAVSTDPELLCVVPDKGAYYGIYGAILRKEERVRLDKDAFPAAASTLLQGYDEFIAIRASMVQAFGVLWMPATGSVVEVRVDYPVHDSTQELNHFHQKMYAQLHASSGSHAVISPVYLHSAIKSLYDATGDGVVTDLAFATTTGSVKNERMRSSLCLREETFHVGGRKALKTEIEPYKIGLHWALPIPGTKQFTYPELFLDGNLHDGTALVSATIRKATTIAEYDWVRNKLEEHL